ncbi:MAG: RNA methyltransferase [Anaerolineae bacterium]|nr:RNA methyltransferase [Anaerolineae bacterium]
MLEKITSFQNPRVKLIKRLRDKKDREHEQRFVIDDPRDLERALGAGYRVDFAFYCPTLPDSQFQFAKADYPVFEVSADLMQKVSYRTNPSAVLAVMHSHALLGGDQLTRIIEGPILALVGLEKPGNIGALLRSADAAGFKTIFSIDTPLDLYNPNIIRSSTGACFLNNVYTLKTSQALTFFKDRRYQIAAAHLEGDRSLYETDFADNTAIVLGTEDVGLPEIWSRQADLLLKIPMIGVISDSLNVSVSGAIFMYEVLRQRLRRL